MEVAEQKREGADALFRSSGYEIKRSPTPMESWTATWDVIVAPLARSRTDLTQEPPTDCIPIRATGEDTASLRGYQDVAG
jgi:hypothetical protein